MPIHKEILVHDQDLVGLWDLYIDAWHQFSSVKEHGPRYEMFMANSKSIRFPFYALDLRNKRATGF
jgi:hypothetical protein